MPGLDETQGQWRYRVRNPEDFVKDSFRTVKIADGVQIVVGKLKADPKGSMKTQSYRFDKKKFTEEQVLAWLRRYGIIKKSNNGEEIVLPKRRIKKLRVNFISLVRSPANREPIILKSDGQEGNNWQKFVELIKTNEEEQMVYGIVYSPDVIDADGDFASVETIKEAAYEFMKAGVTRNVDKGHNYSPEPAYVAESWIVKEGDSLFPNKTGAWAVGIKIEDEDLWREIKRGELAGLSLAGVAEVEPVEKGTIQTEDSLLRKLLKALGIGKTSLEVKVDPPKSLKDLIANWETERRIDDVLWAFKEAIDRLVQLRPADFLNKVEQYFQEFKELMEELLDNVEKGISLQSLPLEEKASWNWDWAKDADAIIKRYGWKGLGAICLYVDKNYPTEEKEEGFPKVKRAYYFPVAKIASDGRLKIYWRGVVAARVRVHTSKLPTEIKEKILTKIKALYKRFRREEDFDKEEKAMKEFEDRLKKVEETIEEIKKSLESGKSSKEEKEKEEGEILKKIIEEFNTLQKEVREIKTRVEEIEKSPQASRQPSEEPQIHKEGKEGEEFAGIFVQKIKA
ncbi:hypothetical protein J7M23_09640 [Candidatus Sumerlaeota bacterium]|nr:hypothetical protein [Candidatus Sumerlaeota bacterium]